jgi:DNA-binding PadR family transcriptional regulator
MIAYVNNDISQDFPMLRYAILELLHHRPLSGYDLRRRFSGSIVFFWKANHSQIYPELKRMENEGLVSAKRVPHEWRPTKKLYAITPKGQRDLEAWLRRRPKLQSVKDEMMLHCFAFHLSPPDEAEAQIRHHRELHEERLRRYNTIRAELERKHGRLLETADPILFWNVLTLRQAIAQERTYIAWCRWALRRHRAFRNRTERGHAELAG